MTAREHIEDALAHLGAIRPTILPGESVVEALLAEHIDAARADLRAALDQIDSRGVAHAPRASSPAAGDSRPAPASTPAATLRALDAQGWDEV